MKDPNENKPGYKKTKVGWIPEEWDCTTLQKKVCILSGGTPSKTEDLYWNGSIPWYSAKDLKQFRLGKSLIQITAKGLRNGTREIQSGTVLVLVRGMMLNRDFPVGLATMQQSAFNQDLKALVPKKEIDPLFLGYWLMTRKRWFLRFVDRSSHGTGKLDTSFLRTSPLPTPPLPEQRKIAEILSTWDEAIDQARKLIDAKKRRKKGLMQQLLTGKKRLPGFEAGDSLLETPLGEMPPDWPLKKLGEVFEKVRRKNEVGEDVVLTASGENGLVDQRTYFTKSVAGHDLSSYYLLRKGEFAYNRSAMAGYPYGAIKRLDRYDAGILSTLYSCFALRHDEGFSDFFMYFFETGLLNRQLRAIAQVGGRAHGLLNVTDSDFYSIVIPVPSEDEQKAIADVLYVMNKEIACHEAELEALEKQKRGLMQKLLTGTVRVKV